MSPLFAVGGDIVKEIPIVAKLRMVLSSSFIKSEYIKGNNFAYISVKFLENHLKVGNFKKLQKVQAISTRCCCSLHNGSGFLRRKLSLVVLSMVSYLNQLVMYFYLLCHCISICFYVLWALLNNVV